MNKTTLEQFDNAWYKPGKSTLFRFLWYCTNATWFNSSFPVNGWKIFLLKRFGAKVGKNVVVKPHVNIKYPWRLTIGNNVWIGEYVWIDNLADVSIGDNVCISQGAMLLCGNHNYKKTTFDLIVGDIILEDGVWIGAKSIVCPGVKCFSHSVLSVASVAVINLDAYSVYQGNPAAKSRERVINA